MSQAVTAFGMSVAHRSDIAAHAIVCFQGNCGSAGARSVKDDPELTSGRIEIPHPSFGRNRDTECGIVQGADQGADARNR
jgi:hypothetical protein